MNLTNFCNLSCINCCSSCRQAPDKSYLPAEKILKFIDESSELGYKWEKIKLWGGEPTTNPDFFKIIEVLKEYKLKNPKTKIAILTNGIGKAVKNKLSKLPNWVIIRDSSKAEGLNKTETFESFNIAPIDLKSYKDADYSKGCWRLERCGIGLGENGYYACGPMIHIDRIFGFNKELKK